MPLYSEIINYFSRYNSQLAKSYGYKAWESIYSLLLQLWTSHWLLPDFGNNEHTVLYVHTLEIIIIHRFWKLTAIYNKNEIF